MPKHVGARLVIHFGLEGEAVIETGRTRGRRAGGDLVVVALEVGQRRPGCFAEVLMSKNRNAVLDDPIEQS